MSQIKNNGINNKDENCVKKPKKDWKKKKKNKTKKNNGSKIEQRQNVTGTKIIPINI